MAKKPRTIPPARNATATAVSASIPSGAPAHFQFPIAQQSAQLFQGPVPPPEILERYDALVPGTAARMFQLAEDESSHRRHQEDKVNAGNLQAQARQLDIAERQAKGVFLSDTIGQFAGWTVSLMCAAGAIYLALNNHDWVAGALAAIPTAAVIQAFFAKRPGHPPSAGGS